MSSDFQWTQEERHWSREDGAMGWVIFENASPCVVEVGNGDKVSQFLRGLWCPGEEWPVAWSGVQWWGEEVTPPTEPNKEVGNVAD